MGGNAVNAVVNIITKDSADTQGSLLSGTYARGDNYNVAVRQGVQFNDKVTGRVFYKHRRSRAIAGRDDFVTDQHTAGVKLQGERSNSDTWQLHFGGTQRSHDQDINTFHWGTGEVDNVYAEIEAYTAYMQLDYATHINERLEAKYKLWAQNQ
ncbi:hypothetical protein JCM19233_5464 [Vibrio astriarenae]|nr:hypothetical protein JCM19233_5464 [Vibrio sp. C7]